MTIPGALLGILIASTIGLAFHLIRGGPSSRIPLYLATSWVSFFIGHFIGSLLNWRFIRLGSLNLFPALLATLVGLATASVLARPAASTRTRRSRGRRKSP